MRTLFILVTGMLPFLLVSCQKDEVKTIAREGTQPELSGATTELVLKKENATEAALSYTWTTSEFGFSGVPEYSLQFDLKGNEFKSPVAKEAGGTTLQLKVSELNGIAFALGLAPEEPTDLQVRVMADLGGGFQPAYSNPVNLRLSSYLDLIEYTYMYVPGSYQGWTPGSAQRLAAVLKADQFEGFIDLAGDATQFKVTPAPNWDLSYGGTSSGNAGLLSTSGSDLSITGGGYYFFTVDMTNKTWKATRTNWGISGTALGGAEDKDMAYDAASGAWSVSLDLVAGTFKFRANNSDDVNFGDNKPADPFLNRNGTAISIENSGNYTISCFLNNPGNYMYSIRKN